MYTVDLPYPQLCTLGFNQLWSKNTRKTIPENPQSRSQICHTPATIYIVFTGFLGGSDGKAPICNGGDPGSIPVLGRSPGEGSGNPLQYSCLENPMGGGAWQATVHGVAKSRT